MPKGTSSTSIEGNLNSRVQSKEQRSPARLCSSSRVPARRDTARWAKARLSLELGARWARAQKGGIINAHPAQGHSARPKVLHRAFPVCSHSVSEFAVEQHRGQRTAWLIISNQETPKKYGHSSSSDQVTTAWLNLQGIWSCTVTVPQMCSWLCAGKIGHLHFYSCFFITENPFLHWSQRKWK